MHSVQASLVDLKHEVAAAKTLSNSATVVLQSKNKPATQAAFDSSDGVESPQQQLCTWLMLGVRLTKGSQRLYSSDNLYRSSSPKPWTVLGLRHHVVMKLLFVTLQVALGEAVHSWRSKSQDKITAMSEALVMSNEVQKCISAAQNESGEKKSRFAEFWYAEIRLSPFA